jgi:very-long-chain enoyl-CoA reductase
MAYTNIGILLGSNHEKMQFLAEYKLSSAQSLFGMIVFIIGQTGNLFHHILLKNLRNSRTDKEYVIPKGGFFEILVCPHYFFELISWLGIAILSTHWESYVVFFIMVCYLSGRSVRTKAWYLEKFNNFPKSRKRIVPFVF